MIWSFLLFAVLAAPRVISWLLLPPSWHMWLWSRPGMCRFGFHWGRPVGLVGNECVHCGARWFD